jgi:hypothetical protein
VLLRTVPLALILAGCSLGQGKSIAGPDVGEANPAVGEALPAVEPGITPVPDCAYAQVAAITPCQGADAGSVCTPTEDLLVGPSPQNWSESGGPPAPEFTWTYPCTPRYYLVALGARSWYIEVSALIGGFDWDTGEYIVPGHSYSPGTPLRVRGTLYDWAIKACTSVGCGPVGHTSFWAGPVCYGDEGLSGQRVPVLLEPLDDAGFIAQEPATGDSIALTWHYEMYPIDACLVKFEGQVSTDKTFTTGVMPILSTTPMEQSGVVGGTVEPCHTYYWRVRAKSATMQGPWSETHSFKVTPPEGWGGCLKSKVQVSATKNASCRIGPSTVYGISAYVPAGEKHAVEGRNAAGTWVKLDIGCYVSASLLTAEVEGTPFPGGPDVGNLISLIPVVPDPPLPTETPLPVCKSTMGPDECPRLGGTWVQNPFGGVGTCNCP